MQHQTVPQTDATESDPRHIAWQLVINGVAGGLPIPAAVDIPGHYNIFSVRLPNNDRAGADAWAAYLGLDALALEEPLKSGVRNYRSLSWDYPALPGWKAEVSSFCDAEDGAK